MPYYTLPSRGGPRHAPSLALFSLHSRAQRATKVRLALSLAAASLDDIFEHPAGHKTPYE
jgi:hypothetical protein